jgi:hypothetical protein
MSRPVVDSMKAWVEHQAASLLGTGVMVEFFQAPESDPPSARIDFETPEVFGRVTAWASGLCDFEMIAVDSGEQVMWDHKEGVQAENVREHLTEFTSRLSLERRKKRQAL